MTKTPQTVLEINLNALSHNYAYLKQKLQSNTKFLAVVKAFAYGSDSTTVAKHLEQLKVDYFAVAYVNEGITLREAGITTPILVLHPQPTNFKALISYCLEPSIYSFNVLHTFLNLAEKNKQKQYPIHLKFNTGLNRLGFNGNDVHTIAEILNTTTALNVKSIFSHLAASEDLTESAFTLQQIMTFKNIAETLSNTIGYSPWLHICNTSGVINYPEAHFNMVRCGIGLYGFGNSAKTDANLKPIASLKSVISQIHFINTGDTVGYNRMHKAQHPEKTATIPIGHADGISRQLGHKKGSVVINNQQAPIIGNVCMDMIMVDVTHIACNEGDEVIIFDPKHTVVQLSKNAQTISYEILTAISQRVARVIKT